MSTSCSRARSRISWKASNESSFLTSSRSQTPCSAESSVQRLRMCTQQFLQDWVHEHTTHADAGNGQARQPACCLMLGTQGPDARAVAASLRRLCIGAGTARMWCSTAEAAAPHQVVVGGHQDAQHVLPAATRASGGLAGRGLGLGLQLWLTPRSWLCRPPGSRGASPGPQQLALELPLAVSRPDGWFHRLAQPWTRVWKPGRQRRASDWPKARPARLKTGSGALWQVSGVAGCGLGCSQSQGEIELEEADSCWGAPHAAQSEHIELKERAWVSSAARIASNRPAGC